MNPITERREARGVTRERIREMLARGLKPREIAIQLGHSTQSVYEHIRALESEDAGAVTPASSRASGGSRDES